MTTETILEGLFSGTIRIHEIEKHCGPIEAAEVRRIFIETKTKKNLSSLTNFPFDLEKVYGRNCENVIGGATLPLGVAGPVKVIGEHAYGEYYLPMATTEGTLIASTNRGCKILSEAGGVRSISKYVGITRAPLFRVENIAKAKEFSVWVKKNQENIRKAGNATDPFMNVADIETFTNGRNVWVRINFLTGDAMGMNMAVLATKAISEWIESNFIGVRTIAISGNLCVDKKPAALNTVLGRGRVVESEAIIPKNLLIKTLKSSAKDIVEVNKNKIWLGGYMSGSLGYNAHTANMIAAIFIATGQDPAHVVEASMASTNMELDGEDLYMHVKIPSLNIATVGGGTGLASQRTCLDIALANVSSEMTESENPNKVEEFNNTQKFAEIIGAAVMAGELSLHAAFANNTFVKAHEDLGRGNK